MSIVSHHIHAEPTSLAILQEHAIPQKMIEALSLFTPASSEAIGRLPHAWGAACLNQVGLDHFASFLPVRQLLQRFLDPEEYLKLLRSHQLCTPLGQGLDEFMRHHPQFRPAIIAGLIEVLEGFPALLASQTSSVTQSILLPRPDDAPEQVPILPAASVQVPRREMPSAVLMLDLLAMLLEGILATPQHATLFVEAGGIRKLMRIYGSRSLPHDFAMAPESFSVSHLFRVAHEQHAAEMFAAAREELIGLLRGVELPQLDLVAALSANDEALLSRVNELFGRLSAILSILGLLCDLYATNQLPGKATAMLVNWLTEAEIISLLSPLLCWSGWEYHRLMLGLPDPAWIDAATRWDPQQQQQQRREPPTGDQPSPLDHRIRNLAALLFCLQKLPICCMSLAAASAKALSGRRTAELDAEEQGRALEALGRYLAAPLSWLLARAETEDYNVWCAFLSISLIQCSMAFFDELGSTRLTIQLLPLLRWVEAGGWASLVQCLGHLQRMPALKAAGRVRPFITSSLSPLSSPWEEAVGCALQGCLRITHASSYRASSWQELSSSRLEAEYVRLLDGIAQVCATLLQDAEFMAALPADTCRLLLGLSLNLLPSLPLEKAGEEDFQRVLHCMSKFSATGYLDANPPFPIETNAYPHLPAFSNLVASPDFLHGTALVIHWVGLVSRLLQRHPQLAYDVAMLILRVDWLQRNEHTALYPLNQYQSRSLVWLADDKCPLPLAVRLQIFAILCNTHDRSIIVKLLLRLGSVLPMAMEALKSTLPTEPVGSPSSPSLLATASLLLANLLSMATAPPNFFRDPEQGIMTPLSLLDGPEWSLCWQLTQAALSRRDLAPEEAHGLLLLATVLTRHWPLCQGLSGEEIAALLASILAQCQTLLKAADRRHCGGLSAALLLIRHLIESPSVLQQTMRENNPMRKSSHLHHLLVDELMTNAPTATSVTGDVMAARSWSDLLSIIGERYQLNDPKDDVLLLREEVEERIREKRAELAKPVPTPATIESPHAKTILRSLVDLFMAGSGQTLSFASAESAMQFEQDATQQEQHFQRVLLVWLITELLNCFSQCHEAFLADDEGGRLQAFLQLALRQMVCCGELGEVTGATPGRPRLLVTGAMWSDALVLAVCSGGAFSTSPHSSPATTNVERYMAGTKAVVEALVSLLREQLDRPFSFDSQSALWCLNVTLTSWLSNKSGQPSLAYAITAQMLGQGMLPLLTRCLSLGHMGLTGKVLANLELLTKLGNRLTYRPAANMPHLGVATDSESSDEGEPNGETEEFGFEPSDYSDGGMSSSDEEDENDDHDDDDDGDTGSDSNLHMLSDAETVSDSDAGSFMTDDSDMDDDTDTDDSEMSDSDQESEVVHLIIRPPPQANAAPSQAGQMIFDVQPVSGQQPPYEIVIEEVRGPHAAAARPHPHPHPHATHRHSRPPRRDRDLLRFLGASHEEGLSIDDGMDFDEDGFEEGEDDDDDDEDEEEEMGDGESDDFDEGHEFGDWERMGGVDGHHGGRRALGGVALGLAGLPFSPADASFAQMARAAALPADAGETHPLLQRPQGAPICQSTRHGDASLLSMRPEPVKTTPAPFNGVREVLRLPHALPSRHRWRQEAEILFGESVPELAANLDEEIPRRLQAATIDGLSRLKEAGIELDVDQPAGGRRGAASSIRDLFGMLDHGDYTDDSDGDDDDDDDDEGDEDDENGEDDDNGHDMDADYMWEDAAAPEEEEVVEVGGEEQPSSQPPQPAAEEGTPFVDPGPDASLILDLPFTMVPEIFEQYFLERRALLPPNNNAQVTIDPSFLARLPNDLRTLYQQMSDRDLRQLRRRHARLLTGEDAFDSEPLNVDSPLNGILQFNSNSIAVVTALGGGGGGGGGLDRVQQMRAEIERALRHLNAGTSANPDFARLNEILNHHPPGTTLPAATSAPTAPATAETGAPLVDAASLATLIVSYYEPALIERQTHHRLLMNLCTHKQTREDLLGMLVYLLESMPTSVAQLQSILQRWWRRDKPDKKDKTAASSGEQTPILAAMTLNSPETPLSPGLAQAPPAAQVSVHPAASLLLPQLTLQLLLYLATHHEAARKHFVTASAQPWRIRRTVKGQASTVVSTPFPLVVLLTCLEHSVVRESPLLVELMLHLVAAVTKPESTRRDAPVEPAAALMTMPLHCLQALVKILTSCELTPKALGYVTSIFQQLDTLAHSRAELISLLSTALGKPLEAAIKDLDRLRLALDSSSPKALLMERSRAMSSPLAYQVRLLRLLKMLSVLATVTVPQEQLIASLSAETIAQAVQALSKPLWGTFTLALSQALCGVCARPETSHLALGLLPSLEAFFLLCRLQGLLQPPRASEIEAQVASFADTHRRTLNQLIHAHPLLLTAGAFAGLIRWPRLLDFDNKRGWFKTLLHRRPANAPLNTTLSLSVRRPQVFEDSYQQLSAKSGDESKKRILLTSF